MPRARDDEPSPGRGRLEGKETPSDASDTVAPETTASSPALFRNETPGDAATTPPRQTPITPRDFGGYEIIEEIARGGMGVVVRARETRLKRIVALKMVLGGALADESDIRRFYIEAEAAAQLQHPGIVPIYEVGDVDGQHFYAMQLIDGPNLKEKAANGPLPPAEAARLCLAVSQAVGYAHQNSIIHRDLKPENVLLTRDGQPMVTDFGLAKSIESSDNLTQSGQILGTPGYMAPEQALGRADQQGPATDIYSLGAILYFLLTGRPPFQAASTLETLDQVVRQQPVSPRDLNPSVPRDIETVCLKCLAKEPRQRYFSAQAFADDLQRFIEGRPVVARPTGRLTAMWRWCLRNRTIAVLAAAFVGSLIAGTVISTRLALLAERRAVESEGNLRESERQKQAAIRNYAMARLAVDRYFTRVSENRLLNQPGLQPLQKELLRDALEYYQRFLAERREDTSLREELAATLFRVGLIEEAVNPDQKVAVKAFQEAIQIQETLLKESPEPDHIQEALADTLSALSRIQMQTGDVESALATARRALDLRLSIVDRRESDPRFQRLVASSQMNLGIIERERGEARAAKQLMLESQRLRESILGTAEQFETRRDLGMGYYNLCNLALDEGDAASALVYIEKAEQAFRVTVDEAPEMLENRSRLALCQRLRADLLAESGDLASAIECYRTATAELRTLARENPDVTDYIIESCVAQMNLASLLQESNELDGAFEELSVSIDGLARVNTQLPSAATLVLLSDARIRLATVELDRENDAAARALLDTVLQTTKGADGQAPEDAELKQLHDEAQQLIDEFFNP